MEMLSVWTCSHLLTHLLAMHLATLDVDGVLRLA